MKARINSIEDYFKREKDINVDDVYPILQVNHDLGTKKNTTGYLIRTGKGEYLTMYSWQVTLLK